jgi:hypothetical protein
LTEAQVQVIFLKSANAYPQCDLSGTHCVAGAIPDAYVAEQHIANNSAVSEMLQGKWTATLSQPETSIHHQPGVWRLCKWQP